MIFSSKKNLGFLGGWHVSTAILLAASVFAPAKAQAPSADGSWLVRDPISGKLFRQQWADVNVQTVKWETEEVEQTVYETKYVTRTYPSHETYYQPLTQYVVQHRVRGLLNPFRTPVNTYEFVPVTTWTPQTRTVNRTITTPQVVARKQKVNVPKAVPVTQTVKQIVQTEVPGAPVLTQVAYSRPLINFPILSRQRVLPWPSANPASPAPAFGVRPIASTVATASAISPVPMPGYRAPLQTASSNSSRSLGQSGMAPTVMR